LRRSRRRYVANPAELRHSFRIESACACRNLGTFTQRRHHNEIIDSRSGNLKRRTMASEYKAQRDETSFSFAVHELRQAKAVQSLNVVPEQKKVSVKDLGSDPYNTSGSFDRKKHWTRVGKR
jgi:hypothetical protein